MADKKHVLICGGTGCLSSKSNKIADNMNAILKEKGMEGRKGGTDWMFRFL